MTFCLSRISVGALQIVFQAESILIPTSLSFAPALKFLAWLNSLRGFDAVVANHI